MSERFNRMARLVELKAPKCVLIIAARSYLSELEGGSDEAIGNWSRHLASLRWSMLLGDIRHWWLTRIRRKTPEQAVAIMFPEYEE